MKKRLIPLMLLLLLLPGLCFGEGTAARYAVDCAGEGTAVSPTLFGLFLEDINFAVDGGLYAQMLRNPSFEYGVLAANGNLHGWSAWGGAAFTVLDGEADGTALNPNNPHYARVENAHDDWAGIQGTGYLDGLAVRAGEACRVSFFARGDGSADAVRLSLRDSRGASLAEQEITGVTKEWQRYEAVLIPSKTVSGGLRLAAAIPKGLMDLDFFSLMPAETFRGLPIRKDLGEYLAALQPSFLRFPGGCVIEGKSLESMYSWKQSIANGFAYEINGVMTTGDPSARRQGVDIWSGNKQNPYYTSYGLGFYEYFLLCEKLDCLPVPVLNAGMTCPVQSPRYTVFPLGSAEFRQSVQDALDLAEFCRGDESTRWGAVRCAMGHAEPFPLRYIAIGNEQWQSEYFEHYYAFVEAFDQAAREKPGIYGGIQLIVANGTSSESHEGWDYLEDYEGDDLLTALVDEHFYNSPAWFLTHTDRYDAYPRQSQARVFLGEYASQSNTLLSALSEAAFMTGLERNGDMVAMACYAPLFGNDTLNQWNPDLIYFSNDSAFPTINYYVQQLFSLNAPILSLPGEMTAEEGEPEALSGRGGLGTWQTSAAFDNVKVVSNKTGETLFEADFDDDTDLPAAGLARHRGKWSIRDGRLIQSSTAAPADANTGDAVYFGDTAWQDYTLAVDAEILSGAEGFLIPVCVRGTNDSIFWNLGGWGNTVSCLQIVTDGMKGGQESGTVRPARLKKNTVYHLKVMVEQRRIRCYVNDELYVDYAPPAPQTLFQSAGLTDNGDLVLKMVNAGSSSAEIDAALLHFDPSAYAGTARAYSLRGDSPAQVNSFDPEGNISPMESEMPVSSEFHVTLPAYSLTVIRIPASAPKE